MTIGTYVFIGLAVVFLAGTWLIPSLGRRRKARNAATLAVFVEIEQRGDDLMVVADAVANCGVRYVRGPGLTYVCDKPAHVDRLHAEHSGDGKVEWYADGDMELVEVGGNYLVPKPTLHEERIPVPARPNALGGWVRVSDERVHRSCEQAYPAGLVCAYCLPILLVHARSVTS